MGSRRVRPLELFIAAVVASFCCKAEVRHDIFGATVIANDIADADGRAGRAWKLVLRRDDCPTRQIEITPPSYDVSKYEGCLAKLKPGDQLRIDKVTPKGQCSVGSKPSTTIGECIWREGWATTGTPCQSTP